MLNQVMGRTTTRLLLLGTALVLVFLVKLVSRGSLPESTNDTVMKDLVRIQIAAEPYLAQHGRCPPSISALAASLEDTDPWDTPYRLSCCPAGDVLVVSAGPDFAFGTADDLTNYSDYDEQASVQATSSPCPAASSAG